MSLRWFLKVILAVICIFSFSVSEDIAAARDNTMHSNISSPEEQAKLDDMCAKNWYFKTLYNYQADRLKFRGELPFSRLELVRIKIIDVDNYKIVLTGEQNNQDIVVDFISSDRQDFLDLLTRFVNKFFEPESFMQLYSENDRKLMKAGIVELGFTSHMVELALGKPNRISSSESNIGDIETWYYNGKTMVLREGYVISIDR